MRPSYDPDLHLPQIPPILPHPGSRHRTHSPPRPENPHRRVIPRIHATNEPSQIACGAPDYVVSKMIGHQTIPVGYIEAKDIGKSLDQVQRSEQVKRYLNSLDNLILTDYFLLGGDLRT